MRNATQHQFSLTLWNGEENGKPFEVLSICGDVPLVNKVLDAFTTAVDLQWLSYEAFRGAKDLCYMALTRSDCTAYSFTSFDGARDFHFRKNRGAKPVVSAMTASIPNMMPSAQARIIKKTDGSLHIDVPTGDKPGRAIVIGAFNALVEDTGIGMTMHENHFFDSNEPGQIETNFWMMKQSSSGGLKRSFEFIPVETPF
jgi:hypothetical protein